MTSKPSIYFVAAELGEVHHGPAVYTRALWDIFRDNEEIDYHLVTLKSDIQHPRIHIPPQESGKRRGFYRRMAEHVLHSVPCDKQNVLLHVNSAHLISRRIATKYRTIVQVNDTEVCQHKVSLGRLKHYGLRRIVALQWRKKRERAVAEQSEVVICNSDFTAQTVCDRYNLSGSKVKRIYKAVPLMPFLEKVPENLYPKCLQLVFIGNNWERKGLRILIEAVGRLNRTNPQLSVLLDVYGQPSDTVLKQFRQLAAAHKVQGQIRFAGVLLRSDAPTVLSNSSMLILPSFEEALGLVTIEALATGIPVVASRVGGIPEVINLPELGTLVSPGDSRKLASAILSQFRKGLSEREIRFRKDSSMRFDIDTLRQNVAGLYQQLFSIPSTG